MFDGNIIVDMVKMKFEKWTMTSKVCYILCHLQKYITLLSIGASPWFELFVDLKKLHE